MWQNITQKIWIFLEAWAEARAQQDIMLKEFRNRQQPGKEYSNGKSN